MFSAQYDSSSTIHNAVSQDIIHTTLQQYKKTKKTVQNESYCKAKHSSFNCYGSARIASAKARN